MSHGRVHEGYAAGHDDGSYGKNNYYKVPDVADASLLPRRLDAPKAHVDRYGDKAKADAALLPGAVTSYKGGGSSALGPWHTPPFLRRSTARARAAAPKLKGPSSY